MLEDLFISKVRVGLLALFLGEPNRQLHIREITRQLKTQINAVRRELKNLNRIGLLKKEPRGNRIYFEVKKTFPLYEELSAMIFKEFGFGRQILTNLEKLGHIHWAFVAKDFFKGEPPKPGSVDLFIVGNINRTVLEPLLAEEEKKRGREINYSVLDDSEFKMRQKGNDPFLISVLQEPRITLTGDEDKYLSRNRVGR